MKVLLYLEAENYLRKSGIGRAIKHQAKALSLVGQHFTTNPRKTYDLVHLNTYGLKSWLLMIKAQKAGKKVIMHGHSTEEDFRNSFIFQIYYLLGLKNTFVTFTIRQMLSLPLPYILSL